MLMLDVVQRIHADVFRALPRQLDGPPALSLPAVGLAAWDARAALQRRQQQVLLQALLRPDQSMQLDSWCCQVLQGTFVLFSGVIPQGPLPEVHPLWQMAEKFGARCTVDMHADVTHVVAKSALTEKVYCTLLAALLAVIA